ncbi:MAG: DUF389 domain-containing protein [Vulcanimicrobiota bacterium]
MTDQVGKAWWQIKTMKEENRATVEQIGERGGPSQHYFVLLVLSTLIASYGLISDSSATVIGAMIVAPLMGPILGLGLALVSGNTRLFYRSLTASFLGSGLVILTGLLVAGIVGPDNIDYAVRELAGRTRPTLYDLAIGLAAGLAGAYCSVHPRLQASVAGVAVAVALMPPLAVTGLTLAGALTGRVAFISVLGSFMLFLVNFLTIEMAAAVVFLMARVGKIQSLVGEKSFLRHIGVQVALLIATSVFLTKQLNVLIRERQFERTIHAVIETELGRIPGANLDGLQVTLSGDRHHLEILAVASSRKEIQPAEVREIENKINTGLHQQSESAEASLVVRAVNSAYVSPIGFLYLPPDSPPDPRRVRLQKLETALREGLEMYPGMELESFRELPAGPDRTTHLLVTVITPYPAEPRLVSEYQDLVNQKLSAQTDGHDPVTMTVRSLIMRSANATRNVEFSSPEMGTTEERIQENFEQQVLGRLEAMVVLESGARLIESHLREVNDFTGPQRPDSHLSRKLVIHAVVEAPQLLDYSKVIDWEDQLSQEFSYQDTRVVVVLTVENRVGTTLRKPKKD